MPVVNGEYGSSTVSVATSRIALGTTLEQRLDSEKTLRALNRKYMGRNDQKRQRTSSPENIIKDNPETEEYPHVISGKCNPCVELSQVAHSQTQNNLANLIPAGLQKLCL